MRSRDERECVRGVVPSLPDRRERRSLLRKRCVRHTMQPRVLQVQRGMPFRFDPSLRRLHAVPDRSERSSELLERQLRTFLQPRVSQVQRLLCVEFQPV